MKRGVPKASLVITVMVALHRHTGRERRVPVRQAWLGNGTNSPVGPHRDGGGHGHLSSCVMDPRSMSLTGESSDSFTRRMLASLMSPGAVR